MLFLPISDNGVYQTLRHLKTLLEILKRSPFCLQLLAVIIYKTEIPLDDDALVKEIMKRTGLFIKEASCNDPEHVLISVDEWTAVGNTLGISEDDISSLRQAAPTEGRSAKFHMDVLFTLKPEEKEKPAEEPEEGEGPAEDPADDPSDDPADDQGGDVSGNPAEAVTEDTSDGQEDPPEDDPIDNQEGDVSKSMLKLFGACVFLVIATYVLPGFFGIVRSDNVMFSW